MSSSGTRVRRQLPSHPSSAGEARRMVRRVLADAGRDDLLESAQLLVSEVVTNALVHSATPIDVSMAAGEDGILVEVGDGSQHVPQLRHYAPTASTGRGLALLDHTADAWGVVPGVRGKTVWFQLSSGDDPPDAPESSTATDPLPPQRGNERAGEPRSAVVPLWSNADDVSVELLNVPLLLHAAWQQHAEGVLRELLLAGIDEADDVEEPLGMHAAATDALAVVAEQIPAPDVPIEPDRLMATAVDPQMSSPQLQLSVPRRSVPHFDALQQALDTGLSLAERGRLLIPSVQPEMRMLRRWLCHQVTSQARGEAPVAWPPPEALTAVPLRACQWAPAPVTEAPTPMLAADDSDLVIAVSPSALQVLGYDRPEDLVGHRLVEIIPDRYRQAHLAGFSLYLQTGRAPLLDQPVQVPALRRDGTEVRVELTVSTQRLPEGRAVFIASLRELS